MSRSRSAIQQTETSQLTTGRSSASRSTAMEEDRGLRFAHPSIRKQASKPGSRKAGPSLTKVRSDKRIIPLNYITWVCLQRRFRRLNSIGIEEKRNNRCLACLSFLLGTMIRVRGLPSKAGGALI